MNAAADNLTPGGNPTPEAFLDGRVTLHCGDSRDVIAALPDCSMDAAVGDPPYALVSIVKRFGKSGSAPAQAGTDGLYARASAGFMGARWDTGEVTFSADFWRQVWRVLKPGAHLVMFSGTRTYHRMVVAIEDAGFEIRDQLAWMYGTGFPKSHNLKGVHEGWGTALKPAWEPIVLARKPLVGTVEANMGAHGVGALHVDVCRIESSPADQAAMARVVGFNISYSNGEAGVSLGGSADGSLHRRDRSEFDATKGRWPANILHDGSDEVVRAFPESESSAPRLTKRSSDAGGRSAFGRFSGQSDVVIGHGDAGSAARFFFSAKADADDRLASKHPTVKPVALMQWLVRLVTPAGGTVLDPFAGTGTTGEAAWREGCRAVLVEREAEYQADIRRRMGLCLAGPEERKRAIVTKKIADNRSHLDLGPLFGSVEAAE